MTRFVLRGSVIPTRVFLVGYCLVALVLSGAPLTSAQRPIRPVGGGHAAAPIHPPVVARPVIPFPQRAPQRAPFARPQNIPSLRVIPGFHRPRFIRPPFFGFRPIFISPWWLNCGPFFSWNYGCNDLLLYSYEIESPPPPLIYENPPAPLYSYVPLDHALVHLYLQDGTMIAVTDYWFVDDQLHFIVSDEDASESEQVINVGELDLQKTIDVNTGRGFRMVRRDQPMDQYLRNHPDANAPPLQPPPKN